MSLKLQNKKAIQEYITNYGKIIERALIREMEIIVAKLENHAKQSAGYNDITANLKSSIGGVVLKDGRPISYSGFEGSEDGANDGKTFINSLISQVGSGYVILIVAGMEYATYVENYHNLNVLKKTELTLQSQMTAMFAKLRAKLNK